jgi:hypothetical protein
MPHQKFLLRDTADINSLLVHLVTHRALPVVDVRVDKLPARDSHRVQHRFAQLSLACNCLVGELLGGATLLVGCSAAWASAHEWRNLGLAIVVALAVALIGKGIEVGWTRARLVLALRDLRYRLAETIAGRMVEPLVQVQDARPYQRALNRNDDDVLHEDRIPPVRSRAVPDRPRMLLRGKGDLCRLGLHLVSHWTLPHMQIEADVLPTRIGQRAQHRLVRLSAGYSYLLAAVLAVLTFLSGFAAILWPQSQIILWKMEQDWSDILLALAATVCAGLLGWAGEILWIRLRLLWVLLRLWFRMRGA